MEILTVNEAKTNFGEMLVQRVSVAEEIKMELLRAKIHQAELDIANGNLTDGETFMKSVRNAAYLSRFDSSLSQIERGDVVSKTISELETME